MRLLLTGSTGFIGRNLLLAAIRSGIYREILVPVRSKEKLTAQILGDGFESVPKMITPLVCSAADWNFRGLGDLDHVVHSAGVIQAGTKEEYFRTNVEGTLRLFASLPPTRRILVLSSQTAAGPTKGDRAYQVESDRPSPITWYGHSKLEMERRLQLEFAEQPYLCLRPPFLLGPRDQMTLPLFKMARGFVHFKPGLKPKYFSFLAVEDVVDAIFCALKDPTDWTTLPSRIFFLSHTEPVTDVDMIEAAAEACGSRGVRFPVPQTLLRGISRIIDAVPTWRAAIPMLTIDRAQEIWPNRWVVSSETFSKRFAWRPKKSLRETMKETRDWYVRTGQLRE